MSDPAQRNLCEITGSVAALEPVRHTPAGIPRRRFWLAHRSRQDEAGAPREVNARIAVVLIGAQQVQAAEALAEGSRVRVSGFLAQAGHRGEARERLQLHADQLESLD